MILAPAAKWAIALFATAAVARTLFVLWQKLRTYWS
jgi:hypothetical protein